MSRHYVLLCALLSAFSAFTQQPEKPNFLFIVIDDLNDHVGSFEGHPEIQTPHIDRLVGEGLQFSNAYCSSPLCAPSRTSFLTGKDPNYTGIVNNREVYQGNDIFRDNFSASTGNETVFTIPELLKDSGNYFTIGIGKIFHRWMAQGHDNDFDTSSADVCSKSKSWNRAFDFDPVVYDVPAFPGPLYQEGVPLFEWTQLADSTEANLMDVIATDSALAILNRYAEDKSAFCDRPLFMAIGYFRPHRPFLAPERYFEPAYNADLYQFPLDLPYNDPANTWPPNGLITPPQPDPVYSDFDDLSYMAQYLSLGQGYRNKDREFNNFPELLDPLPDVDQGLDSLQRAETIIETQKANAVLAYHACIRLIDAQIGRLMETLDAHPDLAKNTIVVLVSDHGFGLGEKRHWGKEDIHETDLRIPMSIRQPNGPAGKVCTRTVGLIDLFPTFLDFGGVTAPVFPDGSAYADGFSLRPLLEQPQSTWNRPYLSTIKYEANAPDAKCFRQYSIRSEDFHYLRYRANDSIQFSPDCNLNTPYLFEELYEIGSKRDRDVNEWYNLIDDPAYREVVEYLSMWLPDSSNFNSKGLAAEIQFTTSSCQLNAGDSVTLNAIVSDNNGPVHDTLLQYFEIKWLVGDTFPGKEQEFSFEANRWALPLLDKDGRLSVTLRVTDTASGNFAVDVIKLDTRAVVPPDPEFTLVKNGAIVEPVAFDPGPLATSVEWDFGDGYSFGEFFSTPPRHLYTDTGKWTVFNRVYYGNKSSCFVSHTDTVSVVSSDLDSLGCQPPSQVIAVPVAPNATRIIWPSVWGAQQYNVQVRTQASLNAVGLILPATINQLYWPGLEEQTGYEMLIQTQCISDTSAWSYSFPFQTATCFPPSSSTFEIAGADSIVFHWVPSDDEYFGHQIKISDSSGSTIFDLPSGQNSFGWGGIVNGDVINATIRTACKSLPITSVILGQKSSEIEYQAPLLSPKNEVQHRPLTIVPNPATGSVDLYWGEGAGIIKIRNLAGITVLNPQMEEDGRSGINIDGLIAGIYIVEISVGERLYTGKLFVVE